MIFEAKNDIKKTEHFDARLKFLSTDKCTIDQQKKFQFYCEDVFAKKDTFLEYKRE
tara:strand:- start:33 stop:200 length:168 start_codon:yes stop_codon:yes gene_type:complete